MSKPTVVFVHGAWHSPKHFQPAREAFEHAGYPTECPCQPTFNAKPGTATMYDDAKSLRLLLDELIEAQGKAVICVLHSYGGVVGTEAIHESLGRTVRHGKGLDGGVLGILYMAAFILPLGGSLLAARGGSHAPFVQVEDDGSTTAKEASHRFYNDLSKEDQNRWVCELRPHPQHAVQAPITYTAYMHHPVVYLYCENDHAVPLDKQKTMVHNSGVDFKTETCTAGHSPYLSQIGILLDVVGRMVV